MTEYETNDVPAPEDQGQEWGRDRAKDVGECALSPASLVGSWFLRVEHSENGIWQGMVVAEPQPGTYLVEIFDWINDRPLGQRLLGLDEMLFSAQTEIDWTFYDTEKAMRAALNGVLAKVAEHA